MARRHFNNASRSSSSETISVVRHDTACQVLNGGRCDCRPETSTEKYVRVCAHCGGILRDRRKAYCQKMCKEDAKVRGKTIAERTERDTEYRARSSEP